MRAIRATETLREWGGEVTAEALRKLVLEATGDETAADEAYCQRILDESRRETARG